MASRAERSDPGLWEKVKTSIQHGDKGGEPGQWSARKAQMAVQEYKRRGGGYEGPKSADNSLTQWTEEEWGTRSGKPSGETGERYLPRQARDHLSKADYQRTSDKKRADTKTGKQFSKQPDDVARKTAPYRHHDGGESTRAALYEEAKQRNLPGRSRMSKEELRKALS
ncbi:hypothetical protein [Azospirillum brasilense]|uniref:hypothetical protein n=1 Tax=Azospirillum brasilense TaxID=192 RepID=UPI000E0B9F02|nr:hypothetical protein [Azospirillum brasilense]